jgi:hypothetical protein
MGKPDRSSKHPRTIDVERHRRESYVEAHTQRGMRRSMTVDSTAEQPSRSAHRRLLVLFGSSARSAIERLVRRLRCHRDISGPGGSPIGAAVVTAS